MIYHEYSGNYFKVIGPKDSPNLGLIVQMISTGTGPNGEHMVLCRRPNSSPLMIALVSKSSSDRKHSVCALFYPANLVSATRAEIDSALSEYQGIEHLAA